MARLLQRTLEHEGYSVALAFNGEEALNIGIAGGLDVIVLDVMLPGRDGFDVIRSLRAAKSTVPTIMVTARDAMSDVVRGLDSGADDYLTKPFALDVLLARIRALSRRGPVAYPADLRFQDLVLNPRTHEMHRGDRVLPLTRTEYGILEVLIRRAGCVVPREVLVEAGWGGGAEVSDNTLYVFIRSLRSKIGGEPQLLHTVRGVGYSLRAEPA
jgi:DNA-binding response OmpR family regulator